MPKDQEVPDSLSLPECWKRSQEYRSLYPDLFPPRETDREEEYGYEDDDEPDLPIMVHISTAFKKPCPFCADVEIGLERFEESCNHLISAHGLTCLHVGSETHRDNDTGALIHSTVAVFSRTPMGETTNRSSDDE
jgi:hypothetical protein